jgi:Domain of unknown function (DUF4296)
LLNLQHLNLYFLPDFNHQTSFKQVNILQKKYFFAPFTALLLGTACQEEQAKLTIPKEKLMNILVDVHFSEAILQNTNQQEKDSLSAILYQEIYTIHGVSEQELKTNVNELRHHPNQMQEIYQNIVKKIRARSDSIPKH